MRWLALILCLAALPLAAQEAPDRAARAEVIQDAFQTWLDGLDGRGALAVRYAGAPVSLTGHGLNPDDPQPIASLSKAITATCAMRLVAEGAWTLETTAGDVLGGTSAATLGELITHTAGLWPDSTQGWSNVLLPLNRLRAPEVGAKALARGADPGLRGTYLYSNENYAVLGDMIAAQTGTSYEAACRARVLAPAGVPAAPAPAVAPMLAWGGWQMAPDDYAAFLHHWYRAPDPAPRHHFGAGYWYGTGMFVRPWGAGYNFWHFGGYCIPGQLEVGSFAVSWRGEWSVVAVYDRCITESQMISLDAVLAAAAHRVLP
ncbi:MAG: serine hydrolase domain-containing protein [Pseudomonadota bacterium]